MGIGGKLKICLISILISLGGTFHFGYQLTSLNPTEAIFRRFINQSYFDHYQYYLDDHQYRLIWSSILSLSIVGDICGAPFLVVISEKLGRKYGLYLSTAVLCLSFLLEASSKWLNSLEMFAVARLIMGLGEGWTVGIQTMFLSECSPNEWRGLSGGISGVFVELGLIAGTVVTLPELLGTDELWPYIYLLECILIFLLWSGLPFVMESPKYLLAKGRTEEARKSLHYFQHDNVDDTLQEISKEVSSHDSKTKISHLILQPHLRRGLLLGLLVWFVSTFSGIEAIDFFSTRLFTDVGLSDQLARLATIGVTCQAFLAALLSSFIVDRIGRRPLLLFTSAGLALTNGLFMILTILYGKYQQAWFGYTCVLVQFVWIFFFGIGPAVMQWIVASELIPQNARSTALAVINVINLGMAVAARFAFFPLHGLVGAYSFLMYIVPLIIFFIIAFFAFPETKNRSVIDVIQKFGYEGDGKEENAGKLLQSQEDSPQVEEMELDVKMK